MKTKSLGEFCLHFWFIFPYFQTCMIHRDCSQKSILKDVLMRTFFFHPTYTRHLIIIAWALDPDFSFLELRSFWSNMFCCRSVLRKLGNKSIFVPTVFSILAWNMADTRVSGWFNGLIKAELNRAFPVHKWHSWNRTFLANNGVCIHSLWRLLFYLSHFPSSLCW